MTTQVHFLEPIPYEEYQGMKTFEIAALVKSRIEAVIEEKTTGESAKKREVDDQSSRFSLNRTYFAAVLRLSSSRAA